MNGLKLNAPPRCSQFSANRTVPGWRQHARQGARSKRVRVRASDKEPTSTKTKPKPKAPDVAPVTPASPPSSPPAIPSYPKDSLPSVLWDKIFYTLEDVITIAKRTVRGVNAQPSGDDRLEREADGVLRYTSDRPIVLVLGSGWASHAFSKVIDIDTFDIIICSPRNHFCFTPMLPATAVGSIEPRSLLEPVRVANPYVSYFEANADSVDLKAKTARCSSANPGPYGEIVDFEIHYDRILVAVGEVPATFGTPGVAEHCFFMKEVRDAVNLRKRVQEQFERAAFLAAKDQEEERAAELRFVIVGGGPTGVEFAGTLSDFLRKDLVKRYPTLVEEAEVVLIQSGEGILPVFEKRLAVKAEENLAALNVTVRTGLKVTEVTKDAVMLSNGEILRHGCCLWSTGNSSRPIIQSMVEQLPEQAQFGKGGNAAKLAVDPYLRIVGAPDALAVGDCSKLVTNPLPTTAQVAGQQGAYVARIINKTTIMGTGGFDTEAPSRKKALSFPNEAKVYRKPFQFLSLGIMAYIGDGQAIVNVEAGSTSFDVWGELAFLLWRSVYITKQVSLRNRILILFDWSKTRLFGRDISMF